LGSREGALVIEESPDTARATEAGTSAGTGNNGGRSLSSVPLKWDDLMLMWERRHLYLSRQSSGATSSWSRA
jgi:hypothetical protein